MNETKQIVVRIQPQSALSRLIAAGKADGRTVAATLHDAVTRLEVMERYASPLAPVKHEQQTDRESRELANKINQFAGPRPGGL